MTDTHDIARRWYGTHQGEHLAHDTDRMVERCATHVMDTLSVSKRQAQDAAMQVLGDLRPREVNGYIDSDACTGGVAVVFDSATQTRHAVTADELITLVRQRGHAHEATPAS